MAKAKTNDNIETTEEYRTVNVHGREVMGMTVRGLRNFLQACDPDSVVCFPDYGDRGNMVGLGACLMTGAAPPEDYVIMLDDKAVKFLGGRV